MSADFIPRFRIWTKKDPARARPSNLVVLAVALRSVSSALLEVFVVSNCCTSRTAEESTDHCSASTVAIAHIVADDRSTECAKSSPSRAITLHVILGGTVAKGKSGGNNND